jgi:hypothetical protein
MEFACPGTDSQIRSFFDAIFEDNIIIQEQMREFDMHSIETLIQVGMRRASTESNHLLRTSREAVLDERLPSEWRNHVNDLRKFREGSNSEDFWMDYFIMILINAAH